MKIIYNITQLLTQKYLQKIKNVGQKKICNLSLIFLLCLFNCLSALLVIVGDNLCRAMHSLEMDSEVEFLKNLNISAKLKHEFENTLACLSVAQMG